LEGNYDQSIQCLQPLWAAADPAAAPFLAAAFAQAGQRDQAWEAAEDMVPSNGEEPAALYARGLYWIKQEDDRQSQACCEAALAASAEFVPARLLLGQLQQRGGDLAAAEASFRQVYAQRPREAEAVSHLALCLYQRGAHDEAGTLLQEAFQAGLKSPGLFECSGLLLFAKKRYGSALRMFERAAPSPAFHPQAVQQMARCHAALRNYSKLREFVGTLSREDRNLPLVVRSEALAVQVLRGCGEALPLLARYVQMAPADLEMRSALVAARLRIGAAQNNFQEADALLEAMEKQFAGTGEVLYLRAMRRVLGGQLEDAMTLCNQALEKLPEHADVHFWKGEILRRKNSARVPKEAYELWRRAIQLDPTHEDAWVTLATCAAARDKNKAREIVEKAVSRGCRQAAFSQVGS
jgi:tetratricopeptide (TPR) repeat protein